MPSNPEFSQAALEFSQALPFPGKRGRMRDAMSAEADMAAAELFTAERKLVADVRTAYSGLYALDREIDNLDASADLLKMISLTASARYEAGESDQEAVLKAQLAVFRLMERRESLVAERAIMAAELNRLLDRQDDSVLATAAGLPDVPSIKADEAWITDAPDVAARQAAIAAAQARLESAKRDVYPDFLVGVGGGIERNVMDGTQMPMAMIRFGVGLPIWQGSKQRPLIRAAEHDRRSAEEERRDAVAETRATLARLGAERQRAERQIVLYREGVIPQTHAALDAARAEYIAGRGDFSTVIEDFNMWLESRVELARLESERYSAWARTEALRPAPQGEMK